MNPRALLALALLALVSVACGDTADELASRDYTDAGCPAAVAAPGWERFVCDRGRGQTPRYVSVPSCAAELGLVMVTGRAATLDSTSPNYQRCRTLPVLVVTIADVSRSSYFIRSGG